MTTTKNTPGASGVGGRPQKGQLIWREGLGWYGRFYATVEGERVRVCRALGTDNKAVARRKLARLIASANPTPEEATRKETLAEAAERIVEGQGDRGVKTWRERLSRLRRYVFPHVGPVAVDRVRPHHVEDVLLEAHKAGLQKQGIVHVRNDMSSVFVQLWRDEIVGDNPVKRVQLPKNLRVDRRPRVILSDFECETFFGCSDVPDHIALMALASRCFGGLRTSDLHAWDWSHVDLDGWETSKVYRPKTDDDDGPAELIEQRIPDLLVEPLKAWWQRWDEQHRRNPERETERLTSGPVFPVLKGKRAGERQGKRSHARELRNALWLVGIHRPLDGFREAKQRLDDAIAELRRMQPDPMAKGKLREKRAEVQALDDTARALCALQSDTERTKRVDFHSFRRAYNTALARAGVNAQTAMRLAGHRRMQTHMRYVMAVEVLETPVEAMPFRALEVPMRREIIEAVGEIPFDSQRPHRESNPGYRRERTPGFPAPKVLPQPGASGPVDEGSRSAVTRTGCPLPSAQWAALLGWGGDEWADPAMA